MKKPVSTSHNKKRVSSPEDRHFPVSSPATGYFGLTWPGKEEARLQAEAPPAGKLVRISSSHLSNDREKNQESQDIIIESDNLDALKLLRSTHAGKVRFIYIDPPYNTGKQFTYRDHFRGLENNGCECRNSDSKPAYHQHIPWLSMMYPRLIQAQALLQEDGIIYVSIDDTEVHYLTMLMDEVFGEENRAGIITWVKKRKGSHLSKKLRSMTEYILVYGKDASKLDLWGEDAYTYKWQPLIKRINNEKMLTFKVGAVETTLKKPFYSNGVYGEGGTAVELLDDIHIESGLIINSFTIRARTVWTQEYLDRELSLGTRVSIRSEGMGPNVFRHDQATKKKRPPTLLDERMGIGTNEDAWNELRDIFGAENVYSYPKPVSLIKYLVNTISKQDPSGLFMDFFAGSGTTGQAVWEANREDDGNRRFILVQSPEMMEKPVELKCGKGCKQITTISQLCIERLKRVANRLFINDSPGFPEIFKVQTD